jgi:hypothetical protein
MRQETTVTEHLLLASGINHLEDVLDYIDQLHSAASDGEAEALNSMSEAEVMNYLQEIIYTAQETLAEIEATRAHRTRKHQPVLRILPKIDKAG